MLAKMKLSKFFRLITICMVIGSLIAVPVFASTLSDTTPPDDYTYSEHFVPMTREEYLQSKVAHENISYEEAARDLDAKILAAAAALPAPLSWSSDTTVDNNDTTYTSYGRVYKIYTHASGLRMRYSVEAVKLRSPHGANWIEVNTGSAWCQPEGSGQYTFDGSVTANMIDRQTIRMAVTGYFEIERTEAIDMGIDLELFSFSHSVGFVTYYRDNVSDVLLERA